MKNLERNGEELKKIAEQTTRNRRAEKRRGRNAVVLHPPKCWELILFHVPSLSNAITTCKMHLIRDVAQSIFTEVAIPLANV